MSICQRGGHSASVVGHYVVIFGGATDRLALNDTWALDIDSGQWHEFKTSGVGPSPRYAHSANVLASNLLIFFGGYDTTQHFNDMFILDLSSRMWSKVEPLNDVPGIAPICPPPRYAHSSTIVGRQLVIFGGCGADGNPLNDLWIFDLETLSWTQPIIQGQAPEARSYHSASLVGDKLLIFGGKTRRSTFFSDVVMLDIGSRSWNPIALAPAKEGAVLGGRAYHTGTVVGDEIVCILGGFNGHKMINEVLLFDLASMRWLTYGRTDMTRCKHTTIFARNTLMMFGGHDGQTFLNTMVKLETDPLYEFVTKNAPPRKSVGPGLDLVKSDAHLIDKENAIAYNQSGVHVKPDVLETQVETVTASLSFLVAAQLGLMEDETLMKFLESVQVATEKIRNEVAVREQKRLRKKQRKQVGFGEVAVREHQRAVGHGNVTSDGGPALGIDSKYADRLMRRLSSYENLRAAVRVPRQEFMKSGYKGPEERVQMLNSSGSSRTSMDLNMQETRRVKEERKESSQCAAAVLISEAGLLPSTGNLKLT